MVPRPIRDWWDETAEIFAVVRVVLGIVMPVFLMLMAFIITCVGIMFIFSFFSSGSR